MPAVDSFVGDGLAPSPYKEALARAERAEAELAEWRDGDHQHPLTVHGYKIMVRHLTDALRKAEAERALFEARLCGMWAWLEQFQPDVFARGIGYAIGQVDKGDAGFHATGEEE